jgi:hypothetical protein
MKQDEIERMVLLEASGELSAAETRRLERHLEDNPETRVLRDQQAHMLMHARAALSTEGPHPSTRVRIRDAAEAQAKHSPVLPIAARCLGYAVALMIMFVAWSTLFRDQRAGRILEINGLMAAARDATLPEASAKLEADLDLEALGRQLLQMQGLAPEEYEFAGFEASAPSSDGAPPPTAFRESNNYAFLPRKYV